jgi:hypothetical protein
MIATLAMTSPLQTTQCSAVTSASATVPSSAATPRSINSCRSAKALWWEAFSGVTGNIVPFGFAKGQIAALAGLNFVGLRRRGITRATLHRLRKAYQSLFFGDGVFADRVDGVAGEFADDPLVQKIVAFVRAGGKRPLMRPNVKREAEDNDDDAS